MNDSMSLDSLDEMNVEPAKAFNVGYDNGLKDNGKLSPYRSESLSRWYRIGYNAAIEHTAQTCPDCNDTGVVPNAWGTGEAAGGYGDYCECKVEEQSA